MTAGPWKIRLIAPDGSRCVRVCQRDEVQREVARYVAQGYALDTRELAVSGGKRTTNPGPL